MKICLVFVDFSAFVPAFFYFSKINIGEDSVELEGLQSISGESF